MSNSELDIHPKTCLMSNCELDPDHQIIFPYNMRKLSKKRRKTRFGEPLFKTSWAYVNDPDMLHRVADCSWLRPCWRLLWTWNSDMCSLHISRIPRNLRSHVYWKPMGPCSISCWTLDCNMGHPVLVLECCCQQHVSASSLETSIHH